MGGCQVDVINFKKNHPALQLKYKMSLWKIEKMAKSAEYQIGAKHNISQ